MSKYTPKQFSPRLYPEWGELLSDLPAEKQAEIFNAILKYPNVELNSGIWVIASFPNQICYNRFQLSR